MLEEAKFVLVLENHKIAPLSLKSKITCGQAAKNVTREASPHHDDEAKKPELT